MSSLLRSNLAPDALEQAICEHQDDSPAALVHHSIRGVQCFAFSYSERLAKGGIEPYVGRRSDSHDNTLAERIIGIFQTEIIRKHEPWRSLEDIEFTAFECVWRFDHHRLLEPIGYVPSVENEEAYYRSVEAQAKGLHSTQRVSDRPGAIQGRSRTIFRP